MKNQINETEVMEEKVMDSVEDNCLDDNATYDHEESTEHKSSTMGWILGIVGASAIVGGVIATVKQLKKKKESVEDIDPENCTEVENCEFQEDELPQK